MTVAFGLSVVLGQQQQYRPFPAAQAASSLPTLTAFSENLPKGQKRSRFPERKNKNGCWLFSTVSRKPP